MVVLLVRSMGSMLKLSPSSIQYLPGLECGEETVELDINQAACDKHRQVLQVSEGAKLDTTPLSIGPGVFSLSGYFLAVSWL